VSTTREGVEQGTAARAPGFWEQLVDRKWPLSVAFVAALLIAWELTGALRDVPRYVLTPTQIAWSTVEAIQAGILPSAIASSMRRLVIGFAIGTSAGVILGLLAGVVRLVEDVTDPLVSLTYPLPKIALFPVFAVWLGFSDQARIVIIALACFYPSFVNSLNGTKGIQPHFLWVARNLGCGKWRSFWSVIVPAALPLVLVGVRISLALSFVLLFATEAIASREGLGFLVFNGYLSARYDLMYTAIFVLAVFGFLADRTLLTVGRHLTRGHDIEAVGRG
jgi:ABC-type nitrate/sulfonate/bicarbonate transport system permease component